MTSEFPERINPRGCYTCKHYLGEDDSGMFPAYRCDIPREDLPHPAPAADGGCTRWEASGLPPAITKRYRREKQGAGA